MEYGTRKKGLELNLQTILSLVGISFVLIQLMGFIFTETMGHIRLGPIVILISVLITSGMGIVVFRKLFMDTGVSKQDMFALVIVALISMVMLFFLRDFVPEIFMQGIVQLQAMVGF